MNASSASSTTKWPQQLLPVPVPDWPNARHVWGDCWPSHVYGFGCAFLVAAALSLASPPPYCFRFCRSSRSTVATSTVSGIVGIVCLAQSIVLLLDAYHSTGRFPVTLVQLVHGLVFPGVIATLTILDRILSALVKPRQNVGSIKHPRLIATALTIYVVSTSTTYLVISVRPQTRLWLLLCQAVSLAWGCVVVFLVACQCLRLARYARVTARSRRQTAMYIRAKRRVEQRLDDDQRRCQLLRHLSRLRVARTKADEFVHQQQRTEEHRLSDIDLQIRTTTSDSSDQLPSEVEVTKTTTVKLSHNHFRYRRRSRRRRRVTGTRSTFAGSDAVRDFTVTALAAARLLWSPSPESDGHCDESPGWQVCLHPTEPPRDGSCRGRKNDSTIGDGKRRDRITSVTVTDSDDDVDNDVEETDSSFESRQHHQRFDVTNAEAKPVSENLTTESGCGDEHLATKSNEPTCRQQLARASLDYSRRNISATNASSTTCLLLDSTDGTQPLSRRLTSATARLLRHAAAQWRKSRRQMTSLPVCDVESSRPISCVARSYTLDTVRRDIEDCDSGTRSSLTLSTGRSLDAVVFENRAYDGRGDVTGCDEAVQGNVDARSMTAVDTGGYLADTELDNVDLRPDPDTGTVSSLPLPVASSVYLGLSRLRGGRTVRMVWKTASVMVTSACVVCCLHIYSMLGVFGVLSNERPAAAWPWFGFQTIYRLSELVYFYSLLAVTWSLQRRRRRRLVT